MTCADVQEKILEAFETTGADAAVRQRTIDAHVASCPACATFAARQRALDARLGASLAPPALSPAFRAGVRQRIRHEAVQQAPRGWMDAMPDVLHLASWGVATAAGMKLLPFDAITTAGVGTMAAVVTYLLLMVVREAIEDLPESYATPESVRSIT